MPFFHADHVGSLLRPTALKEAFRHLREGRIGAAEYEAALTDAIRGAVRTQEEAGLESITDGEFGRNSWFGFFFERMEGFRLEPAAFKFRDGEGGTYEWPTCYACERMRRRAPIALDEHRRLAALTKRTPKTTLPSPSAFHFFRFNAPADRALYPDDAQYWDDLVAVYREEIAALGEAGCTYLQRILDKRPAGMTIAMHLCRGNFHSRWMASGGYEPVAERLFNDVPVDTYFLEYDSERAGDFSPLRWVPKGKHVVLGLVSSKVAGLESADELRRRIDEAARYVPMERLGLSPQCGFASVAGGNLLSEAEQAAKLSLVVDVACGVWGSADAA